MDKSKVELIKEFAGSVITEPVLDWNVLMTIVLKIEKDGYYLQTTRNAELQFAEFRVGEGHHTFVHAKGSCEATDPDAKYKAILDAVYNFILVDQKKRENASTFTH